jgi:uncharacterized membrane protein
MTEMTAEQSPPLGVPDLRPLTRADLGAALRAGWTDFLYAPGFGVMFALVYVLGGYAIVAILGFTGKSWAVLPLVLGFPLLGPFAAVGLYEVSRRIEARAPLDWRAILGVVWRQKDRQLPSIAAVVLVFFLFWNFLAHMIFALFMGLQVMTNVTSSFEVFLTPNGLMMLAVGTAVGAVFSFLLFALTVVALPLLLDREVDFVTAMITSFGVVTANLPLMLGWGIIAAGLVFVGMIPGFLGLFVVLPLLGHATWHLYARMAH